MTKKIASQKIATQKKGATRKPSKKPVDGITARPRHLVREINTSDVKQAFVSVRPQFGPQSPVGGSGEIEVVKSRDGRTMVIPKLTQLRVPQILKQEVIVRLPRRWSFRASLFLIVQYMALAAIAVASGYSTGIGQWFVLAYAVYALITRQDSRLSFGIALFILVSVPFFQAIGQPGVANNMAVYVYELLVVGTVQALIELRRDDAHHTQV